MVILPHRGNGEQAKAEGLGRANSMTQCFKEKIRFGDTENPFISSGAETLPLSTRVGLGKVDVTTLDAVYFHQLKAAGLRTALQPVV